MAEGVGDDASAGGATGPGRLCLAALATPRKNPRPTLNGTDDRCRGSRLTALPEGLWLVFLVSQLELCAKSPSERMRNAPKMLCYLLIQRLMISSP